MACGWRLGSSPLGQIQIACQIQQIIWDFLSPAGGESRYIICASLGSEVTGMQSHRPERGLVRFGPFEADLEEASFASTASRSSCRRQPFQVLAALLENPGTLVSRNEFQQPPLGRGHIRRFRARIERSRYQAQTGLGRFGGTAAVCRNRRETRLPFLRHSGQGRKSRRAGGRRRAPRSRPLSFRGRRPGGSAVCSSTHFSRSSGSPCSHWSRAIG